MILNQKNINHLLWRSGFGPDLHTNEFKSVEELTDLIFTSSKSFDPITLHDWKPVTTKEEKAFTPEQRTAYHRKEKLARLSIINQIYNRQAQSKSFLREKMTLFWMGHFACRVPNPKFMLKYYNAIGENALGKFGDLLKVMIRNAALLGYLNNNINRKSSPNENFARELMELFTLGIGHYTEKDVKEGARAFTGWGFDREGDFLLRKEHHDEGVKSFHGKSGNFDGDDIIKILLEKKECAEFITTKIYRYFVNGTVDHNRITSLSTIFFNSGYNIEVLMKEIFSAEWFFASENIGARIKSPVELIAGIVKLFNIKFENEISRVALQKVLGQTLFDPPNVAGWPDGLNWIDSSTLMYRIRLPEVLLQDADTLSAPKEDFDAQDAMKYQALNGQKGKKIKTLFETNSFIKKFSAKDPALILKSMSDFLLQNNPGDDKFKLIENYTKGSDPQTKILRTAVYLMSLPEYQTC